ncbi:MAG: winged helix-turn-helix transcriptional regulator [Intestinibacter sp.]
MKKETTKEDYLKKIMTTPIDDNCPVKRTLEMLNGKWRMNIIYELCRNDSMRFGELKKAYPKITNTMLTKTLRDLEEIGIVHREQFNEIPPHVEYSLTEKGRELLPVFFEIYKWGAKNLK